MALSNAKFRELCQKEVEWLRSFAPKDTGNLAYNAIKISFPAENVCEIYINESIAPYMKFTEYPWLSLKWNGKKNPNEGWFENAAKMIYYGLAEKLSGKGNADLDDIFNNYEKWSEGYYKWKTSKQR